MWLKVATPSWGRGAICESGNISPLGGGAEEPLLEGVLFLMRLCCFLHLTDTHGAPPGCLALCHRMFWG